MRGSALDQTQRNKIINMFSDLKEDGKKEESLNLIHDVTLDNNISLKPQNEFMLFIYTYNFTPSESQLITYRVSRFYTCASCIFAIVIKNLFFYYIKNSHLIQRDHSVNDYGENENINENIIKNNSWIFKKMTSILHTLIEVEPSLTLIHETIVLETLYVLQFRIYKCASMFQQPDDTTDTTDETLEILFIINALQYFIITNCREDMLLKEDINKTTNGLFGYTINLSVLKHFDALLQYINKFDLDQQPICFLNTILYDNIDLAEYKSQIENLYSDIENTTISVGVSDYHTINSLIKKAKNTSDIMEIHNCMNLITRVFMYLIHSKIESFITKFENLNKESKDRLKALLKKLTIMTLPTDILNYLKYVDVELVESKNTPTQFIEKVFLHHENQFVGVKNHNQNSIYELPDFIEEFLILDRNFQCFSRVYNFLQIAFKRHATLYDGIENKIKTIKSTISSDSYTKRNCKFIERLYLACLNITHIINEAAANILQTDASDSGKNDYTVRLCSEYDKLKNYIFWAINKNILFTQEPYFLNIARNVAFTLANFKCSEKREFLDDYKRPVYLIMIELSNYEIEKCSTIPNRRSYMLFNYVPLCLIGHDESVKSYLTESFNIPTDTKLLKDDKFDFRYLFQNIIQKSQVVKRFNNIIKFYWKGGVKSLDEMFMHVMSPVTLNVRFLYELNENIFKFYYVAFFLQINKFYKDLKIIEEGHIDEFNKCVKGFNKNYFPNKMQPFVTSLKNNAILPSATPYGKFSSNHWYPETFLTTINEWFVVVHQVETKKKISIHIARSEKVKYKQNIQELNEINLDLENVLKSILLLQ